VKVGWGRVGVGWSVPWRGGDSGDKVMGPRALAGSRGTREDQITCIKWGSAKAKSRAPEGLRKVKYGCVPPLFLS
jgi:hypothetical protein